jgi:hypothetical protein
MNDEKSVLLDFVNNHFFNIASFSNRLWSLEEDAEYVSNVDERDIFKEIADSVGACYFSNGASKLVLFFDELEDYVIKIPLQGSIEAEESLVYEVEDSSNYIDLEDLNYLPYDRDYCFEEALNYKKAKQNGVEKYFAKTEFLTTIDGVDIYYSEKVEGLSPYSNFYKSKVEDSEYYKTAEELTENGARDAWENKWIAVALLTSTVKEIKKLINFLNKENIEDLAGYSNILVDGDGKIKIIDYSSFYG